MGRMDHGDLLMITDRGIPFPLPHEKFKDLVLHKAEDVTTIIAHCVQSISRRGTANVLSPAEVKRL